jgi:AcrR family transcriptional regulator
MSESPGLADIEQLDNRSRIIDAALTVFAEKGYHGTLLEDIVHASGLTEDDLLECFEGKSDLYYQTCYHALELWMRAFSDNLCDEEDALGRLRLITRAGFLYPVHHPEVRKLLEDGPMMVVFVSERYADIMDQGKQYLKSVLEEGIESGVFRPLDCDAVADLMFNLYKYYILSFYIGSSTIDHEQFVNFLEDILIYGLIRR